MKAIVLERYGPPDGLQLRELAKPEPGENQVLVRVHNAAVNDWDWCFVRGRPYVYRLMFGLRRPSVAVLGAEVAGTVEATGESARRFQPGDRVYGDLSEAGFGAFAEYVCVREDALAPMPAGMSFEQAAAIPHAAMLAYQGLVDVGRIERGNRLLINGAGGGVGMIGLQIAKQYGAEVTGVDSGPKLDAMREAGFDHVIDYRREDFTASGERYDLILDTKSDRSPLRYLRALAPAGRYATVGGRVPRLVQIGLLGSLISRISGKGVHMVVIKPNKDLDYVNDLFTSKGLECLIDGPYPLSDVPQAIQRFGEAKHIGKVVITVAS